MRHRVRNAKLGRNTAHRHALVANLVKSLTKHKRITTTLAKAKAAAPVAEKMITLAKSGSLHDRRLATSRLQYQSRSTYDHKSKAHKEAYRQHYDVIRILFDELGPQFKDRNGGYTRIVKLTDKRRGDAGEQAILMWVSGEVEPKAKSSKPAAKIAEKPKDQEPEAQVSEGDSEAEATEESSEDKKD